MVEMGCNGVNYMPFGCVGLDLNHCGPLYFLLLFLFKIFANVEWHLLFLSCIWLINLGFLFYIHLLLGLACVLPLMENI